MIADGDSLHRLVNSGRSASTCCMLLWRRWHRRPNNNEDVGAVSNSIPEVHAASAKTEAVQDIGKSQ